MSRLEFRLEDVPRLRERRDLLADLDSRYSSETRLLVDTADPAALDFTRPVVGLIGTRRPTSYGLRFVAEWVQAQASFGWTLVSGGAFGIDAAAHRAALRAGLPTWGCVVGPLARPNPQSHAELFAELRGTSGSALLTSESLEPGDGRNPHRYDWVRRNAWLVALCDVLIVVEGLRPSGTWSSAEFARAMEIPVFALPGPIYSPQSEATNLMISNGLATSILSVEDLVQSLVVRLGGDSYNGYRRPFSGSSGGVSNAQKLRSVLGSSPYERYPKIEAKLLEFLVDATRDSSGVDLWKVLGEGKTKGFSSQSVLQALRDLEAGGEIRIAGHRLERRGNL